MTTLGIAGTGLIGGSVGLGMRNHGWTVVGWDPDEGNLGDGVGLGAIDTAVSSPSELFDVDILLLAGPLGAIVDFIPDLPSDLVVTDVAGVKTVVATAASHLGCFVPGHPMAGREFSGPQGATGSMFRGAGWILCPEGRDPEAVKIVESLVDQLGAYPVTMTAEEHDHAVGLVSHLPQLVASALVDMIDSEEIRDLAAGGFRDVTRVAQSDPRWWTDILLSNAAVLQPIIKSLGSRFDRLGDALGDGSGEVLQEFMESARQTRIQMAAPVDNVRMVIEDRPGEFAKVGSALADSGVDLRDLQLRHATDGGGGVLTLSVREGEAPALIKALKDHGFRIIP